MKIKLRDSKADDAKIAELARENKQLKKRIKRLESLLGFDAVPDSQPQAYRKS